MIIIFIEEDKAKYIQEKERTLFKDLEKASNKLHEVAHWYSISNYTLIAKDKENFKSLIQYTNNIYESLKQLLFKTKDLELIKNLPQIITDEKLDSLEEFEQKVLEIRDNQNSIMNERSITLDFNELSQLNKLKGHLIPLCLDNHPELEEFVPVIDSLIKKYQDEKSDKYIDK